MTRILIVDDDRAFRLSTAALLRADGYDVEGVADGAAAAARIASVLQSECGHIAHAATSRNSEEKERAIKYLP